MCLRGGTLHEGQCLILTVLQGLARSMERLLVLQCAEGMHTLQEHRYSVVSVPPVETCLSPVCLSDLVQLVKKQRNNANMPLSYGQDYS